MPSFLKIRQAAAIVRSGGIVAYPTAGVYGLGCDPGDRGAVERILAMKRRRESAGLILLAAHPRQLDGWIAPADEEARRFAAERDGITWVVTAARGTPGWITGGRSTVAVRITRHPVAAALCVAAGIPLVSTSANRRGCPPALTALAVRGAFGTSVDYVLAGETGLRSGPSEIRDARTGATLRAG